MLKMAINIFMIIHTNIYVFACGIKQESVDATVHFTHTHTHTRPDTDATTHLGVFLESFLLLLQGVFTESSRVATEGLVCGEVWGRHLHLTVSLVQPRTVGAVSLTTVTGLGQGMLCYVRQWQFLPGVLFRALHISLPHTTVNLNATAAERDV